MNVKRFAAALALTFVAAMPSAARADTLLTPFAGITFGGAAESNSTGAFGASIGWMGAGIFGFEGEFAYAPSFFDQGDDFDFVDSDNVVTVMANVIVGAPIGGDDGRSVRPYATAGIGLMKTNITSNNQLFGNISNSDFGINVGAGVMGFFSDHVGLRGDIRYFRALTDPEEDNEFDVDFGGFDFWRGSLGLTFRF